MGNVSKETEPDPNCNLHVWLPPHNVNAIDCHKHALTNETVQVAFCPVQSEHPLLPIPEKGNLYCARHHLDSKDSR